MSALDLVPAYVREQIEARAYIRPDLLAIPSAERHGWTTTFRNNHWHNCAQFQKGDIHVWRAGTRRGGIMWRRARLDRATNLFRDHEWIASLGAALEIPEITR